MLVTPAGEWVLEDSSEFLAALGDPAPDYDAAAFAVKNLGFIKFQILDQSVIEIDMHPATVELPALLAVQQQINTSTVPLFRIRYLTTVWQSEIHSSREAAIARLSELCAARFALTNRERFLVEPQDYSRLFEDESNPLQLLAQKWRMSLGHFDPSVISFAITQQLLSRLIIAGVKPPGNEPVFRFIGDGHANWLDPDYHLHAIGKKMTDQPDREYGGWVSEFYKSVALSGEPRYDFVTARIQRPPETYVTRYERLLLPWKTPSDEVLVTLSSRRFNDSPSSRPAAVEPDSAVVKYLARSS
jgi:hypothetical protein